MRRSYGSASLGFAVSLLLPVRVSAHGAMQRPVPRNNNPNGLVNYGTKFRIIEGGLAWDDFNVHDCVGGYQTAAEFTWDVCSRPEHHEHNRPAYLISRKHPSTATKVVDCTGKNDCSASSQRPLSSDPDDAIAGTVADDEATSASAGFVWLTAYTAGNCSSTPAVSYKMRIETCTQFPVSGQHYWTGGCEGYACMWFSQGCSIGCPECTGNTTDHWKSLCGSSMKPTITDKRLLTFNRNGKDPEGDWTASHPWRAPGTAPVLDACGAAGGFYKNNEGPGGHPPPGYHWGDKGSDLPMVKQTVWTAGSIVEVSWGIAANHGGGYQYRLCPKGESLSEECFQRLPLPFATATQVLILGNGTSVEIEGTFVSTGTKPMGSTWAMNPVPACGDAIPGTYGRQCRYPQFPPPLGCDESCWGDSDETLRQDHGHAVMPTIVDHLQLPETLLPGEYVLGWRWDCEQTPQVWASCSDVIIRSARDLVV